MTLVLTEIIVSDPGAFFYRLFHFIDLNGLP